MTARLAQVLEPELDVTHLAGVPGWVVGVISDRPRNQLAAANHPPPVAQDVCRIPRCSLRGYDRRRGKAGVLAFQVAPGILTLVDVCIGVDHRHAMTSLYM